MKSFKLTMRQLIGVLVICSLILYVVHYLIFRDFHHIAIFFVHDLAFLPLEVILVSLGLDRLIESTHENEIKSKTSIIETLFFNESGSRILRYLIRFDPDAKKLATMLNLSMDWRPSNYAAAGRQLKLYPFELDADRLDFYGIHYHLNEHMAFYRNILENPAMTQSNRFTEMVMNIYLLGEELEGRTDLYNLAEADRRFLGELLRQIYRELTEYWLDNAYNHSLHHKTRLHHLVVTNPFIE
ncbi:MAG: hypothetical protein IK141_07525 [Clostridia bacterium]|nr:hypothetical protein [Clostridia bacterium]